MAISSTNATAQDLMHEGCTCINADGSILDAARMMTDMGVGALPICGTDDRLIGMLTDRDIVVKCVAQGLDPVSTHARHLADGSIVYVFDDTPAAEVLSKMEEHLVRRVPVIDHDTKQLVGIISQGDIATHMGSVPAGELVNVISEAPPLEHAR